MEKEKNSRKGVCQTDNLTTVFVGKDSVTVTAKPTKQIPGENQPGRGSWTVDYASAQSFISKLLSDLLGFAFIELFFYNFPLKL